MDPTLHLVCRLGLAALFAAAAVHKLRDLAAFRATLAAYALLPAALVRPAALLLPGVEIATSIGLLAGGAYGGAVAAALLLLYSAAIGWNLWRGRTEIDCGCFARAVRAPLGVDLIIRNGLLLAVAIAAAGQPGERPLSALDAVAVVGAVVTAGLLLAGFEAARSNRRGANPA